VNESKEATLPLKWAREKFQEKGELANYLDRHDLDHLPDNLDDFWDFYVARRDRMFNRLSLVLGASPSEAGPQDEEVLVKSVPDG
jgi:hypothetical protein